jgi:hypothetical protein
VGQRQDTVLVGELRAEQVEVTLDLGANPGRPALHQHEVSRSPAQIVNAISPSGLTTRRDSARAMRGRPTWFSTKLATTVSNPPSG